MTNPVIITTTPELGTPELLARLRQEAIAAGDERMHEWFGRWTDDGDE